MKKPKPRPYTAKHVAELYPTHPVFPEGDWTPELVAAFNGPVPPAMRPRVATPKRRGFISASAGVSIEQLIRDAEKIYAKEKSK